MSGSQFLAVGLLQAEPLPLAGSFEPFLAALILLLPLVGFVANGLLALSGGRRAADRIREGSAGEAGPKRWTHVLPTWIGPGVVGVAFALTLVNFVRMLRVELHEPFVHSYWTWIATGDLAVEAAIQLDQLSLIMMMVITGVGFLIHLFSTGYMREDPGSPRYFCYLNLFVFFMLVLVMGASFPLMFVGWEGVGLCSYLLIGFWFEDPEKANAGKKAFIVNRIGDFGFLMAIFLIFANLGAVDYLSVFDAAPEQLAYGGGLATRIALFLLLGAIGKSAQVPLYVWLPDAMAGPTPVSALIHAATMVTAGVYLIARAGVLFALAPVGSVTVATIGAVTALFAATIALQQYDIKKVLAYSTISQLGFMFLGVGAGAYAAGVFHLMTHAFFKALLFLGAGAVIHSMHEALRATRSDWDAQDMRNMGGLRRFMPLTWATMGIGTLAIAGIWPFTGFFSKDEILWYAGAAAGGGFGGLFTILWGMALVSAALTAIYMTRLMVMTFYGPNRMGSEETKHLHEAPLVMTLPLAVLAVLSIFGGWINVPEAMQESIFGGFGALPMSGWLHHWLEPVTESADAIRLSGLGPYAESAPLGGGHVVWGAVATGLAVTMVVLSARAMSRQEIVPATDSEPPETGLRKALYHKWYVDELYDRGLVRPLVSASRFAWQWIDQRLIDRAVDTVGSVARAIGWMGSLFQTGQVTTYAAVLTLGALTILSVLVF